MLVPPWIELCAVDLLFLEPRRRGADLVDSRGGELALSSASCNTSPSAATKSTLRVAAFCSCAVSV